MSRSALIVRRVDYARTRPGYQIIDFDVTDEEAAALVAEGRAEWDEVEAPPAVYLLREMLIHDVVWPEGSFLSVGGEITAAEALALLRGRVARNEAVASAARGGIG